MYPRFQTVWMARLTLEGRESPLENPSESLELWGFALFPNPSEHVPESQGEEVIKLKDPGTFLLICVGA